MTPALRGRQGRVLLAYLVVNRGRPVSRDELIAALWPQRPPGDPSAALRTQLSRLRSALGSQALAGRDTVELQLPPSTWVDIEAAEDAIQAAEAALASSEWKTAWAHANVALNISSRPFLAGFEALWVDEVRRELAEMQSRARESIARSGIGLGGSELAGAERSARELVRTAPFRESGYVLLMRALVASGNTAEALRVYERLRRVLREELGTAPGAEIQALHRRLLTGRESDDDHPARPSPVAAPLAPQSDPSGAGLPLPTWLVPARRSPFVGRTAELTRLEHVWEEAAAGERQIVLVSGEPGMGKTRLATEFAQGVHEGAGAGVLYGRADEHGTLGYQPFVEALRHWAINTSGEELQSCLGRHAPALARLVPEITIRLPEPPIGDGELPRDLMFDAVTATLSAIAASRPTLLVIDDLHWADPGTLLLFRQLARSPHSSRLMVLATHRETEPSDVLAETLADLGREQLFERLRLGGLRPEETAALIASIQGTRSSPALAQAIHSETAGNPFLVEALVHHLAEHSQAVDELWRAGARPSREAIYAGGVPSLVRDAVSHRASELGPDVERVLEVASVVGREFESDLLIEVSDLLPDIVVSALESAVKAGLLIDVPGTLDRYAFSHSLFRQTVYASLSKVRRTALHRRLAESLERRHGSDPRHVAELARHYSGAGAGAAPKALEYCVRAGAAALGAFAYDEAIEHYGHALLAIDVAAADDESLRCEVLLALGEAEWRGGRTEDARETFARAARIARSVGDAEALARAALGFCGLGGERFGADDSDARDLLESALSAGPQNAALRARLTARLAELAHAAGRSADAGELALSAVEIGRASGDDGALASALIGRWYAVLRPDGLEERLALVDELLSLGPGLHDRDAVLQTQMLRARGAVEIGDMEALAAAIGEHAKLAEQSKQPGNQLQSRALRATRALMRGRFDEVEGLAAEVIELGMLAQSPEALHYSAIELIAMRWEQGRIDELAEPLRHLEERSGAAVWRAALALWLSETGDFERGRAEYDALTADRCAAVPFDGNWLATLAFLTAATVRFEATDAAADLFQLFEPYRDRFVVVGATAASLGPVSHYLGTLASLEQDPRRAVALLEEACEASRRSGAEPWLARSRYRLGLALRDRGGSGDSARARQLISESQEVAERLGMSRLAESAGDAESGARARA